MSYTTPPPAPPMSFSTAISTGFRRYAEFTGRSGVAEFWWFMLFVVLVNAATKSLDSALLGTDSGDTGLFGTLWALGTIVPVLAIAVRRLRDGGNRWTQLFWLLLPVAGLIVIIVRFCDPTQVATPTRPVDAPVV
jgi:uncharacterized membrane protein YhaH (DUF805 family)